MFLGANLGAGPDPRTMTCEKINKGMEQNAYAAQYRAGATHKANAAARVKELEPFYQACKKGIDPATVTPTITPDLPVTVPPVYLQPGDIGTGGGSSTIPAVYRPGGTGALVGGGSASVSLDWKKIAMIVGGGVALVLVLKMLSKKRKGSAAAGTSKTVTSAASVGMGGGI